MKLAVKTCTLDTYRFTDMLDYVKSLGVRHLEIGTGNWSSAPHIDLDAMLSSSTVREKWLDALRQRDMQVVALNCSGNPLAYVHDMEITRKTFQLSALLGLHKVVMMSGLPAGCASDTTPCWITTSWPPETQSILAYQWEEIAIPRWRELAHMATACGITQIALENHAMQLVYNPETCLRLRDAVGNIIGMNLDPSHLFWMGGDPMSALRVLGDADALYHIHGKDSRLEQHLYQPNGVLDTKPIADFSKRAWNYVAVGCGHGEQWWSEFISVARMCGYNDVISLEMEDLTQSVQAGVESSLRVLRNALNLPL